MRNIWTFFFVIPHLVYSQDFQYDKSREELYLSEISVFSLGLEDRLDISDVKLTFLEFTYSNDSLVVFNSDSVSVEIAIQPFRAENHILTYDDSIGGLTEIDSRPFYAEYDEIDTPSTEFHNITCSINGIDVNIPISAYHDLFDPLFFADKETGKASLGVILSEDRDRLYIHLSCVDNGWEVTFIIDTNEYRARFLIG